MVRILLAEDHAAIRQRLKRLLHQEPEFRITAETGDGLEAVRLAVDIRPDVLVTDLAMPGLSGLEVVERVRQQAPRVRIVIVSIHADEPYVMEAFRRGALAYVRKDEAVRHLVPAIRAALEGRHYLGHSPAETARSLAIDRSDRERSPAIAALSSRDREALRLAAQGRADSEIAFYLKVTTGQATRLRTRLMRQLGLQTHANLTALARREGLIGKRS